MTIVFPDTHFPTPPRNAPKSSIETRLEELREQHVRNRIVEAKRFLAALAKAIKFTTGGGLKGRWPRVLLANMLDAELHKLDHARGYVRNHREEQPKRIAAKTGISVSEAEQLKASLRIWEQLAAMRVAVRFKGSSWEDIQRHASVGRTLRAEHERRARHLPLRRSKRRLP
ncbi:MAG: hypothetical protein H0T46_30160 [Deltaproteobacteria bacterium]|nr:hypothetical protein [Deltaproteobacteria bacterium]